MGDVGKFGKVMGHMHPRLKKKLPAEPPRATPKKIKRPKQAKRFGFEAKVWRKHRGTGEWHTSRWGLHRNWYATAKQRDQAMGTFHPYFCEPGWCKVELRIISRLTKGEEE